MGERFAYDEVAYPSTVIDLLSADRIRAAGILHGVAGARVETASVLEIGCGDGVNLLGAAAAEPGGRYAGFDLSDRAVARGVALRDAAGLADVDLHAGDILTYPRAGPRFDYIMAHGVYAWVQTAVADALLALIAARLADGGIAYVSFDCLPASAPKQALHAFLAKQTAGFIDDATRESRARETIATLAANQHEGSSMKAALDEIVARLDGFSSGYFFHDYLSPHYHPASVKDFSKAAARYGLKLIGDAGLSDLVDEGLDAPAKALLAGAGEDTADRFHTLDMLRGSRMFRRALLVRADAPPPRAVGDALTFSVICDRAAGVGYVDFTGEDGTQVRLRQPQWMAAMDALRDASAGECSAGDLAARAGTNPATALALMTRLAALGLVTPHASRQPFVLQPGSMPLVPQLIRAQLAAGDWAIALRPARVRVDVEPTRIFLGLCDGTRTREALAAAMSSALGAPVGLDLIEAAIAENAPRRVFAA